MEIEERRKRIQEVYERLKSGTSRSQLFDYLLYLGFEKDDASLILRGCEERIQRNIEIRKAETDIYTPILFIIAGAFLLFVAKFMMFPKEGVFIFDGLSIGALIIGLVCLPAGIISFLLKLRNKLTKKYEV